LFNEISAADFIARRDEFDVVFDARSPSEFRKAAVPRAINLYALDDDERASIGTMYAFSPFEARAFGASLICKNTARHLLELGRQRTPASKMAIYCARGGMRSSSIAIILAHVGYRIWRVTGGFKAYRNEVLSFFTNLPDYRFFVLDGLSGSGKSSIIRALSWSIDLENLANHRGSVFGEISGVQSATMKFENELHYQLCRFERNLPIAIEAESKTIGRAVCPKALYEAMQRSIRVWIDSPLEDRAKRIADEYGAIDQEAFDRAMKRIAHLLPRKIYEKICKAFNKSDRQECAYLLLKEHYDKVYKKPSKIDAVITFDSLQSVVEKLEEMRSCDT
jgi:tRNA 2-selenouridine synthase